MAEGVITTEGSNECIPATGEVSGPANAEF